MGQPQRISTIERQYPDQWVVVEVTRMSRMNQAIAGRVLGQALDEDQITCATVQARACAPDAILYTFYTGARIPEGIAVILAVV